MPLIILHGALPYDHYRFAKTCGPLAHVRLFVLSQCFCPFFFFVLHTFQITVDVIYLNILPKLIVPKTPFFRILLNALGKSPGTLGNHTPSQNCIDSCKIWQKYSLNLTIVVLK